MGRLTDKKRSPFLVVPLVLVVGLVLFVCVSLAVYQPDRPVETIVPGSSSGPAFRVQIIRPRVGLPLGGILPPGLFGLDAHLGFDATSAGAAIDRVDARHIELRADDWQLVLVLDADGNVAPETEVVFEIVFEDEPRKVRCRPANSAVGTLHTSKLAQSSELSGNFDIELAPCEDAETGRSIGWPAEPLVLHGSFDRLPLGIGAKGR